jgi:hypothetical protein
MHEFRQEFETLLEVADIDRLVVLVDDLDRCLPETAIGTVRRQGFWNQELLKLRESSAHLVGFIMRRVVCDASGALRVSVA